MRVRIRGVHARADARRACACGCEACMRVQMRGVHARADACMRALDPALSVGEDEDEAPAFGTRNLTFSFERCTCLRFFLARACGLT